MPKAKADNNRSKVTKRPRKEVPQQISTTANSNSAGSEESFEIINTPTPSDSIKNGQDEETEECFSQDFSGQMSSLLKQFNSDLNKTMQAKRKKLEQFTQESTRQTTKKVLETNKNQTMERRKLVEHFRSQFFNLIEQGENELEKIKETEEKLQKLLVQQQKHQQQVRICHSQRMKAFRTLCEEYFKGMNELEESHVQQYSAVHNELRKEMALLQKKILMETQQQEMMNVRKNLKKCFT